MKKVLINKCYGGFSVSESILHILGVDCSHLDPADFGHDSIEELRTDKNLIAVIEKQGLEESSGKWAELKIVEIPDDVEFTIEGYDGLEWVAEKHRTWE